MKNLNYYNSICKSRKSNQEFNYTDKLIYHETNTTPNKYRIYNYWLQNLFFKIKMQILSEKENGPKPNKYCTQP